MENMEIAEFIIYTINEIANLKKQPTTTVYRILSDVGCIKNYLTPFYDVLHTMSSQNVVEDVLQYVRMRGKEI